MRTICLIGRPSPAMRRTVELVCWRRRNPSYRSLSAPVSRPGWPGRDRFPCPACWSTSSTRSRCDLCRCVAVTPTRSSSNSPPLNHATGSNPTRPPFAIAPNKSRARSANSCGRRRACSSTRAADPRPRRTCRTPADSRNAPPSAGHGRVPDATAQAPSKAPRRKVYRPRLNCSPVRCIDVAWKSGYGSRGSGPGRLHCCGCGRGRGAGGGAVPALDGRLEYRQAHETLARTGGDGASGRGRCRAAAGIGRPARRSCAEGPARRQFRRGLVVCALHETPSFDRNAVQRRHS